MTLPQRPHLPAIKTETLEVDIKLHFLLLHVFRQNVTLQTMTRVEWIRGDDLFEF